jgi:hypothetical protein
MEGVAAPPERVGDGTQLLARLAARASVCWRR